MIHEPKKDRKTRLAGWIDEPFSLFAATALKKALESEIKES